MRNARSSLCFGLLACVLLPARIQGSISFAEPTSAYIAETNLVTFADPDESLIGSISDGTETISFSSVTSLMRASTVGDDWGTWGSPPNTESSTPRVLWSGQDDNFNPVTTVTFLLSDPVSIFGFEAEPDDFGVHTMVATFSMGSTAEDTITLDVSGNAGAMLFAVEADPGVYFDSVTFTSDIDWAAGQFRYAAAPEPRSAAMMLAGLGIIFTIFKRIRGTQ